MKYTELIALLQENSEQEFAAFQRKLIPTKQKILGVRTPVMRKIARTLERDIQTLFGFPDEYFEVTFIKLTAVSHLPYEQFISYLLPCVSRIDNWATCDCFKAKGIKNHLQEFLPVLETIFSQGGEFYQRYVLVVLLTEYVQDEYLPVLKRYLEEADTTFYYVHMAAAWLTAEILIKRYEYGVSLLKEGILGNKTHNKAIQKAIESYRLTSKQKEYLRSLKIKTK